MIVGDIGHNPGPLPSFPGAQNQQYLPLFPLTALTTPHTQPAFRHPRRLVPCAFCGTGGQHEYGGGLLLFVREGLPSCSAGGDGGFDLVGRPSVRVEGLHDISAGRVEVRDGTASSVALSCLVPCKTVSVLSATLLKFVCQRNRVLAPEDLTWLHQTRRSVVLHALVLVSLLVGFCNDEPSTMATFSSPWRNFRAPGERQNLPRR